jgi:spore coat polysaccharide biosynthesis predicted glycosyltransferase SpsG
VKIAFVTDGGKEMGMGHVQQSITLALELKDNAEITFLTKSDESIVSQIRNAQFNVIAKFGDDQLLQSLRQIAPQWVIIDKIDVAEDFARRIKEDTPSKLAIFTNITTANKYADIAVTADYGSSFKNVKYFDEKTKTLYYFGPRYWILRKEFYDLSRKTTKNSDKIERILLIFGGSDPLNITSAVLDELLHLPENYFIDIILGTGFTFINELHRVLEKHSAKNSSVHIYRNIQNIAEMMFNADLVMASPGLSLFEALSLFKPVIAMHQNELQADAYRGFIATIDKSEIDRLAGMLAGKNFINPYDDFIVNLEIGQGKKELLDIFLKGIS